MCPLVFAQVTRVSTCKLAEPAFVRLLALVQRTDVGLQLRMRCCCVATAVTYVRSLAGVCPLVVVFGLIGSKRLVTALVATSVWAVACVAEKMTRQLGALLEVFGVCFTTFPLAEAMCAIVNVSGLDVFVEGFGAVKDGETEDTGRMLPAGSD